MGVLGIELPEVFRTSGNLCLEMPNTVFRWRAMKAMGEPLEG